MKMSSFIVPNLPEIPITTDAFACEPGVGRQTDLGQRFRDRREGQPTVSHGPLAPR
jgi:hypothetical protein